jgi:VCBS repeat-containing protein
LLCDTATVTISVGNVNTTVDVRVAASSDDAEEDPSGNIDLNSSDLELVLESSIQTVGMRFNGISIPQGATISSAYIQFQADETNSEPTTLSIQGQLVVNAPTFSSTNGDISNRTKTTAAVSWNPVPWTIRNEAGPNQQTPDIAPVIQAIVNQSGWSDGNSLVIIITGSGKRVVEAYDGVSTAAPLLHVEFTSGPPNNPPTAVDDTGSVAEGGTLNQAVPGILDNDSDPDNDPLTISTTPVTPPTNGSLTLGTDGSYTYSHDGSETTADSFVYEVCDTGSLCDTATVSITITPVNDPPVANAGGPYSGVVGVSLQFDASGSSDVDGTISTYSWTFGDGNNGTGVNPTHTYATTGDYSVQLTVTDNGGESSTDITTASISAEPNNPPTAVDDTGSVAEGGTLNQATPGILDNDSDPDSDPLTISTTPVTSPTNGSLTLGTDGSYTYTHDGSETTADSFVYEVCDTGSLCDNATVSITITPVNDPPLATDDSGTVTKGGTLNQAAPGILDNDSDPENDLLTITTTTPMTGAKRLLIASCMRSVTLNRCATRLQF